MTEYAKIIKAKELKIGDEILQAGFFREVEELKEKEGAITIGCQSGDLVCYQFFDIDSLFAVKTHRQNEDKEPDEQEDTINIKLNRLMTEHFEDFLIENIFKYMYKWQRDNSIENLKTTKSYMDELIKLWSDDECYL